VTQINQKMIKQPLKNLSGIYGWMNIKNKKIYIGSALDLSHRPFKHLNHSSNQHLENALNKYGLENFVLIIFVVINHKDLVTKKELMEFENYFISSFDKNQLYNILDLAYSSVGYKHTLEAKIKIKNARLGKSHSQMTKEILSQLSLNLKNPFYGQTHSEELKKKFSMSRKGKLNPMFNKKKSIEFIDHMTKDKFGKNNFQSKLTKITNIKTNEILIFDTFKEASNYLKSPINTLRNARNKNILYKNEWKIETIKKD
jgi:group I intron endonuclease